MNQPTINRWHLERIAFVYVRQSTPSQVKKNVEGGERQRRMQQRVKELGWPNHQVKLLGADTGHSGSSLHGRDDYQTMLQAVLDQKAGIICASELSRLVRDNQDWNQLVRVCRHRTVLLADEHRIYDSNDPHDRVSLGIQGAFNEFELAIIFLIDIDIDIWELGVVPKNSEHRTGSPRGTGRSEFATTLRTTCGFQSRKSARGCG